MEELWLDASSGELICMISGFLELCTTWIDMIWYDLDVISKLLGDAKGE